MTASDYSLELLFIAKINGTVIVNQNHDFPSSKLFLKVLMSIQFGHSYSLPLDLELVRTFQPTFSSEPLCAGILHMGQFAVTWVTSL